MREQIELDLHRQFAENQNSHQNVFMQLVVAFIGIFAGLGYVYSHLETSVVKITEDALLFKPFVMHVSIMIAGFLFCLMALVVIHFGWSFRRDMLLNRKIRELAYGKDGQVRFEKLFKDYGKNIDDMPEFYEIFFKAILIMQVGLLIFVIYFDWGCNVCTATQTCCPLINFCLIILEFIIQASYYYRQQDKVKYQFVRMFPENE